MTETMRAVFINEDQSLSLIDLPRPVAGPGEVLIRIAAAGLNRADLIQRKGFYPPPPGAPETMGLECAGTIEAVGSNVRRWKVGDRVCALLAGGGYADFVSVDAGSLLPVPEGMSDTEAASLPEAMMTVWANVLDRSALMSGEAFLIHGGTSGIGVMAIQMARMAGASPIYATAGSDEKCRIATSLGATRAINYRTEDFARIISDAGGVDVTLDMIGGDYVQKNIDISRLNGRICNIAYMNGSKVELDLMRLMLKRLILTGTTLRARSVEEKRRIRDAVEKSFWPAVVSGEIRPVLDEVFPLAKAEKAQAKMAKGGHIGKIILEM